MPPAQQPDPSSQVCSGDIWLLIQQIASSVYPWWYPDAAKTLAVDFFIYGTEYLPLGAGASVTNNINIDGNSAFACLSGQLVETADDDTTFLAQRPLLLSILDTGSGVVLSNIPIHADNWWGTAERPYFWPVPKIFAPNSTLQVTVQNLEAAERHVRLALSGIKIFSFRPGG